MKIAYTLVVLITSVLFFNNPVDKKSPKEARLNDIQIIGSHNSYKVAIEKPLFEYLLKKEPKLSSLEYDHIPLSGQLDLGLRNLELDVFHDPEGGHFSNPKGLEIIKSMGLEPRPFDVEQKLKTPGLKVFHIQEVDFRSHQLLFKEALMELKAWSNANLGHTPIIITINTKDSEVPETRKPLPFDAQALQNLNTEIRDIFSEENLITPDFVKGDYDTLEKAILDKGWPELTRVKNKFLFVLDEGDEKTDAYLSNFSNSKGAALFVNKEEGNPNSAFRVINDPVADFEKIKKLVALGYMVRTRADADTKEARTNDYSRFEKAKASGAQVITTDYYLPSSFFKSDYKISFENDTYERIKSN